MTPTPEGPPPAHAAAHDLRIIGALVLGIGLLGDMYEGGAWGISCLATAAGIFLLAAFFEHRGQGHNGGHRH